MLKACQNNILNNGLECLSLQESWLQSLISKRKRGLAWSGQLHAPAFNPQATREVGEEAAMVAFTFKFL